MSLCINPHCSKPDNSNNVLFCQSCGSELLLEGRYRTIKQLGQGGFGRTYEVIDVIHNFSRVLKILIRNEPKAVELFQREAQVLKVLNHPGIPKVEEGDYFIYFPRASQEPLHCLVMEKIEGMDLYEYMKQREYRPIKEKLAVQWLKEIVSVLQLVHDQKYFHRDIKPSNIMLRATTGHLVLIDFGAVREATSTYYFAHQQNQVTGISSPGYTPNEQINFQAVPQSDFFALGRTFVFLLTGKEPTDPKIFDSYNDELRWKTIALQISPKFGDLIDRMMARLPGQRPADTREILQSLVEIEQSVIKPQSSSSESSPSIPSTVQQTQSTPQRLNSANPQATVGWGLWWLWLLANLVGFATLGILLPITQWLVLRNRVSRLPKTGWWVLATYVGLILGFFVGLFAAAAMSASEFNAIAAGVWISVGFAVLGIIQWLLLRKWVSKSQDWIWANVAAIVVAPIVVARFVPFNVGGHGSDSGLLIIGIVLGFVVHTAITGLSLMELLKNPISKS